MRLSVRTLSFGTALACTLAACDDDPGEVALRIDPTAFVVDTGGGAPAPSITITLDNSSAVAATVRLCNEPDPNPPTAPLVLQEQADDDSWHDVENWVICLDPGDGFDQVVDAGSEQLIGRLRPANHSGRFRYELDFTGSGGASQTVTSPPFTVEIH